jgi:transposase
VINEVVNVLDLKELYDRYSDLVSSAYHPQMMLKVLFYGYAGGERSYRVIAHRVRRWMSKKMSRLDKTIYLLSLS